MPNLWETSNVTNTISTIEAARLLGVTRERARQLCDEGRLRAQKLGRDWRIEPRAVEEYRRIHQKRLAEVNP